MKRRLTLLCLVFLLCSGCTLQNRMPSESVVPSVIPTQSAPPATTAPPLTTTQEKKPEVPIKQVYAISGIYTDQNGTAMEYSFRIPYVDLTGPDAQRANKEIESTSRSTAAAQERLMEERQSLTVTEIDYEDYKNGEILTLMVRHRTVDGKVFYVVYNFNAETGEKVDGSLLIQQAGLTQEEFLEKVRDRLSSTFTTMYSKYEASDSLLYATRYQQTLSEDNYGVDMPIYLDEQGGLRVIATVYTVYGAGTEYITLKISD